MAIISRTRRPVRSGAFSTLACLAAPLLSAVLLTSACSDLADPRDYGGGSEGQEFAQCVTRTEDDNPSLAREEAAKLCTCLNERIAEGTEEPISNGTVDRAENQRALLRCAADLGIEVG